MNNNNNNTHYYNYHTECSAFYSLSNMTWFLISILMSFYIYSFITHNYISSEMPLSTKLEVVQEQYAGFKKAFIIVIIKDTLMALNIIFTIFINTIPGIVMSIISFIIVFILDLLLNIKTINVYKNHINDANYNINEENNIKNESNSSIINNIKMNNNNNLKQNSKNIHSSTTKKSKFKSNNNLLLSSSSSSRNNISINNDDDYDDFSDG